MLLRPCQQGLVLQGARPQKARKQRAVLVQSSSVYTQLDACPNYTTFRPPVVDIANIIAGQTPTQQQIQQVRQECSATGFLAVKGHGISEQQLKQLFAAAQQLFDLPLDTKMQLVAENLQRGRGYEISPEHKEYMQAFQQQQQQHQGVHLPHSFSEPSAAAGILSERFCCGPSLSKQLLQDPYYSSDLGQVFFTNNNWPTGLVPALQPAMQGCYAQCEVVAAAVLCLFAVALGVQQDFFVDKCTRHHSNLQVANYPSQLLPPGPADLRKKAHVDSGTLTLLASQDWLPGSSWQAGDGGLQLLSVQGQWLEVEVPPGALLLNIGSLMSRWTNGIWKATLHRVTNPLPSNAHSSRRLSMAFFHKPNYDALIEVLPTCYSQPVAQQQQQQQQQQGVDDTGLLSQQQQLPSKPLFPPAVVGDVTRQGILHNLRQLPPEEASKRYHEALSAIRSAGGG